MLEHPVKDAFREREFPCFDKRSHDGVQHVCVDDLAGVDHGFVGGGNTRDVLAVATVGDESRVRVSVELDLAALHFVEEGVHEAVPAGAGGGVEEDVEACGGVMVVGDADGAAFFPHGEGEVDVGAGSGGVGTGHEGDGLVPFGGVDAEVDAAHVLEYGEVLVHGGTVALRDRHEAFEKVVEVFFVEMAGAVFGWRVDPHFQEILIKAISSPTPSTFRVKEKTGSYIESGAQQTRKWLRPFDRFWLQKIAFRLESQLCVAGVTSYI